VAVQLCVEVPHPLLTVTPLLGKSVVLLLLAVTVSEPAPLTVKDTGVVAPPAVMLCEPPAVTLMLGDDGLVTVIVPVAEAVR
jgi:hypothetical protein